jgi:hypothetical protein
VRGGLRGAQRHAPAAPYLVSIKNNSDGDRMKSCSAFEFTVRKMIRGNAKLYFWTFTFREVHSLKTAMGLWNQFLTLLKRRLQFRGVRVLELHEEHGCHFHVVTNKRYAIRKIQAFKDRYGFGRMDVRVAPDVSKAIRYLCKYLSKPRPGCLRRARLWSAFGEIERTRVKDILTDTPMSRLLRAAMGKPSVAQVLAGIETETRAVGRFRPEKNFIRAIEKAKLAYLVEFDPAHIERQAIWAKVKAASFASPGQAWSDRDLSREEE